jgi:hypothetical protein
MSYELHLHVVDGFDPAYALEPGLAFRTRGRLTYIAVEDDRDVATLIRSLLIPNPPGVSGRWKCRIPGVDMILYAVRISSETMDEVLRLSAGQEDYVGFEVPQAEERLWFGQGSHSGWRESNLPHVSPRESGWVQCLRCGGKLTGHRAVVWHVPMGAVPGMWSEVGLHLPSCRVTDPTCCPKCGGEKDNEGWCANYCTNE